MENLFKKSQLALQKIKNLKHKRYLFDKLSELKHQLVGIRGARGTGKTTIMLQLLDKLKQPPDVAIYVSLDDPFFTKNTFTDFIEKFYSLGGKYVFADEVHKYKNWSREIKNVYDFYADIKIIFSASSILELFKSETDLARRAIMFDLHELSLREYILLKHNIQLPILNFEEITKRHTKIASELTSQTFRPVKLLKEYFNFGAYPFSIENNEFYLEQLSRIIDLILEIDIPAIENIEFSTVYKLKKLLKVIADSVPFKPNITKLSKEINTTRDRLLKFLFILERAKLIFNINTETQGISYLRKPEKILMHNSNLLAAYADSPNIGTIREIFFVNQVSVKFKVNYAKQGDFVINNKTFEIGGKNKTSKQIATIPAAYLVVDDVEIGYDKKIPLWLFGLLY